MNIGAGKYMNPLRAVTGSCLILSVPSVILSESLKSGLTLGLVSAALLVVLSPLRMDTEKSLAVASMFAATFATLVSILLSAIWPSDGWSTGGTFSLLVVFNVVLLGRSLSRYATQTFLGRGWGALLSSGLFVAALVLLLLLKIVFGIGLKSFSLKPLQFAFLLYPGGIFLVAGLLYAMLKEEPER
jgi:Na+-translocating ferredoxin:NAD+ oxidoreductase RnfE subunit|tara:strand:+ start:2907 stop:3464 length:558 start_codon:yes stop_codon:yes gene_type:complete